MARTTVTAVTDMEMVPTAGDEELDYVRSQVRAMVRAGFSSFDEVLQAADEMLESDAVPSLRTAAEGAARREWQERVGEQATWVDEGSYTALAAAFADLESLGVVARMSFACCNTCGATEIQDEADPNGPDALGHTFFHSQEADRLEDTPGDLFLSFGGFDEIPAAAVGEIVATTVARHGLEVDWAGDAGAKVRVRVPDWRKRLPGEAPLGVPARLRVRPNAVCRRSTRLRTTCSCSSTRSGVVASSSSSSRTWRTRTGLPRRSSKATGRGSSSSIVRARTARSTRRRAPISCLRTGF